MNIHWKDWCWSWNSNTLATWCKELSQWKRSWCWARWKAGGEGDDRGSDGWVESPTVWTWVWASSWCWWWTERPGVLQYTGWQIVRHDWVTKLTDTNNYYLLCSRYWTRCMRTFPVICLRTLMVKFDGSEVKASDWNEGHGVAKSQPWLNNWTEPNLPSPRL